MVNQIGKVISVLTNGELLTTILKLCGFSMAAVADHSGEAMATHFA